MNDFLIVKNMKNFIMSLDNIVVNYPRKENVIKDRLFNDSLEPCSFFILWELFNTPPFAFKDIV